MKVQLTTQLVDHEGLPATQTTPRGYKADGSAKEIVEVPVTLAYAIKTALNFIEKEQSPENSFKRGALIVKINKAVATGLEEDNPDFTSEEITDIKQMAGKVWNPVIAYQIAEALKV